MPQYHFVQSQITAKPLLAYPAYFSTGEGSILLRRSHAAIYVPCQITYVRSPMEVLRQWHKEWAALWKVMFDIPGRKISSQIHSKIPNDYITLLRPSLLSNKMEQKNWAKTVFEEKYLFKSWCGVEKCSLNVRTFFFFKFMEINASSLYDNCTNKMYIAVELYSGNSS